MKMEYWFNPPIAIYGEQPGLTLNVSNVPAAAEQLLKWNRKGPKWRKAVDICRQALAGTKTAAEARVAFEAAAKEAKMWREYRR